RVEQIVDEVEVAAVVALVSGAHALEVAHRVPPGFRGMSDAIRPRAANGSRPLRPVALLELLAGAAPARVVAADLLVLGDHALPRRDAAAVRPDRGRGRDRIARPRSGGHDRVRAGKRLVLVRESAVAGRLPLLVLLELRRLGRLDLGVEERDDDLLPDRRVELLEHRVALRG